MQGFRSQQNLNKEMLNSNIPNCDSFVCYYLKLRTVVFATAENF